MPPVPGLVCRYAKRHLRAHLQNTWDSAQTQADVALVRDQVASDAAAGSTTAMQVPVPGPEAGKAAVSAAVSTNLEAAMAVDEKNPALKTVQVCKISLSLLIAMS